MEEGADRFCYAPPSRFYFLLSYLRGDHRTFQLPLENCFANVVLAVGHVVLFARPTRLSDLAGVPVIRHVAALVVKQVVRS